MTGSAGHVLTGELESAQKIYHAAYKVATGDDDAIYTGINAASMAFLLGDKGHARSIAKLVESRCRRRLKKGADYWALATLAELALIAADVPTAEKRYQEAAGQAEGNLGDLSSTRRQARLMLSALGEATRALDHCFGVPVVVAFAGHMVDRPGRPQPRFPPYLEQAVSSAIAQKLEDVGAGVGFASAACGADILFLEQMLKRKRGEIHIVLPFGAESFVESSVDIARGGNWSKRLWKVHDSATEVTVASAQSEFGSNATYSFGNKLLDGLAVLRARSLDTELITMALWDRKRKGDGPGGTAAFVKDWTRKGRSPVVIDINKLREPQVVSLARKSAKPVPGPTHRRRRRSDFDEKIMAMLFADVVGYSTLSEERIPSFIRHFMGGIADLIDRSTQKPVSRNSWGDAIYLVFRTVGGAGRFSLELADFMNGTRWVSHGLPADLNLRIALHVGPVFQYRDPFLGRRNYTGTHVSQAARIEPITPPGEVYASQSFAAVSASESCTGFTCDYVGQISLAKKYGVLPLFHVRRL